MFRFIYFIVSEHRDCSLQSGFAFAASWEVPVPKLGSPCTDKIDREMTSCIEHEVSFWIGPNTFTSVFRPVFSFSFRNETTVQVPTSCCLSDSAAPRDDAAHMRAAAIVMVGSAFMTAPSRFRGDLP